MDSAVANHEFEKARFYSDEERKERENLAILLEKYELGKEPAVTVSAADVEEVISRWSEYPYRP
jgi:ATP-dependent Clp protease ATP-binding subunit ClpC